MVAEVPRALLLVEAVEAAGDAVTQALVSNDSALSELAFGL